MSLDSDLFFDRRRLKRQLTFWRLATLAALVAVAVVWAAGTEGVADKDHVARLTVSGIILDDPDRLAALDRVLGDPHAKALVIDIDSPGGTFVGGEALYEKLRRVAARKPVIAVMGGVATSAGYMVALAADRILARRGTLTGSIGVILQTADVTELLAKIGVKPEVFKSGPLKAQPNPFEKLDEAGRAATRDILMDLYDQFVAMVVERRGMTRDAVLKLADGRVFSGRAALGNGLIDGLGAEPEARAWLAGARKVAKDLPIRDVRYGKEAFPWRDLLTAQFQKALFSERLSLDGVVSLWHPSM